MRTRAARVARCSTRCGVVRRDDERPRLVEHRVEQLRALRRRARCTARRARAAPGRAAARGRARAAAASRARTSRRGRGGPPRARTARAASRRARPLVDPVEPREQRQVLERRQLAVDVRARGRGSRSAARGGSSTRPRVGAAQPGEDAQQRRLAGAVRPGDEQEAAVGRGRRRHREARACRRSASRGRARAITSGSTSAAARGSPSGWPGSGERVGDLLHLADPAPALRRGRALRARKPLERAPGAGALRRARPRRRWRARPRGSRAAAPSCPSTTRRTPSSAPRHSGRRASSTIEPANSAATVAGAARPRGTDASSRARVGGRRRCRRRRTAAAAPPPLPRALRRDRVRVDVDPVEAAHGARDVERRVRRADREDQLGLADERRRPCRRRGSAAARAAVASLRPSEAQITSWPSPRARRPPPSPSHPDAEARRSQDVGQHEHEERDGDDAVHGEERGVEPPEVAGPDERVLVDEERSRRTATPSQ